MRAVVDTNVIAYFLLGTESFQAECAAFWRRAEDALAPASWEPEVANVLQAVLAAFPEIAKRPGELVGAAG